MSITPDDLERLWNERKIAIHFPLNKFGKLANRDNISLDPEDYPRHDASAISTFVELSQKGGYVCAQYYTRSECLVGLIDPGTKIEFIEGTWNNNKREAIFKSLKFKDAKVLKQSQSALILIGRPQQGTIRRWRMIGDRIKYLIEGKKLSQTIESLLPSQQEILCSEFLRLWQSKYQISHLLIPVGRTMKDIDICGVSIAGHMVYAQVTFLKRDNAEMKRKFSQLKGYSGEGNNRLIIFCDCEKQVYEEGILIYPIREAFRIFTSTNSGKIWLERALV